MVWAKRGQGMRQAAGRGRPWPKQGEPNRGNMRLPGHFVPEPKAAPPQEHPVGMWGGLPTWQVSQVLTPPFLMLRRGASGVPRSHVVRPWWPRSHPGQGALEGPQCCLGQAVPGLASQGCCPPGPLALHRGPTLHGPFLSTPGWPLASCWFPLGHPSFLFLL